MDKNYDKQTTLQTKTQVYLVSRRLMMDGEQSSDDDVTGYVCYNPSFGLGRFSLIRSNPNGEN